MTVIERAYAKINLFLDVMRKRNDGFHDILSVMHSVDLCDIVTLSCIESDNTEIVITTNASDIPIDDNNIVYRAAKTYLSYFNINARVDIHLEKRIPVGAGLGGGSSDGAATLRALNKIFRKADIDQLHDLAADIGSDVPFCVLGGLCICFGRGEMFTSVSEIENMTFVVAIGDGRVSTPKAYAALDKLYYNFTVKMGDQTISNNEAIIKMLSDGEKNIPAYNIFEQVIKNDEIAKIKEIMIKNKAEYALMSGSGPSVFGKFAEQIDAEKACRYLIEKGFTAFVCHSVYPEVGL